MFCIRTLEVTAVQLKVGARRVSQVRFLLLTGSRSPFTLCSCLGEDWRFATTCQLSTKY